MIRCIPALDSPSFTTVDEKVPYYCFLLISPLLF